MTHTPLPTFDEMTDFKPSQSDLLYEIKAEIIELNRVMTDAETELLFGRGARTTSAYSVADVYRAISLLLKNVREVIPKRVADDTDAWLLTVSGASDRQEFLDAAYQHSAAMQEALFAIGIKDTNIKHCAKYEMEAYMELL